MATGVTGQNPTAVNPAMVGHLPEPGNAMLQLQIPLERIALARVQK